MKRTFLFFPPKNAKLVVHRCLQNEFAELQQQSGLQLARNKTGNFATQPIITQHPDT